MTFHITALGTANGPLAVTEGVLGLTSGNNIWIDDNADGYGWYTGLSGAAFPRHVAGREFEAGASSPARDKVDLLTVVMHELGHVLGYADIDPSVSTDDWMTATLAPGIRRLPDPLRSTASAIPTSPRIDLSAHENAFGSGENGLPWLLAWPSEDGRAAWARPGARV